MSDNCSQTYSLLYESGGIELSTYNTPTYNFFPASSNQWKREYIQIAGLTPSDKILLKFVGVNRKGNNLFIDNIMLQEGAIYVDVENIEITEVEIYPNPATDLLNVSVTERFAEGNIRVIDFLGRVLLEQKATREGSVSLNLNTFEKGTYLIELTKGDARIVEKFVKL